MIERLKIVWRDKSSPLDISIPQTDDACNALLLKPLTPCGSGMGT
jgi:hypothetical protein